jgi:hypothetical protein
MATKEALLSPAGAPSLIVDEALNDSDKTFVVPAGFMYDIIWVYVELTTTATVGNRAMTVDIQDSLGDVIGRCQDDGVQAASLTHTYMFGQGMDLADGGVNTNHFIPLPPLLLPQFFKLRVYDATAVDAAADDMNVQIMCTHRFSSEAIPAPKLLRPAKADLSILGYVPVGTGDFIAHVPAQADLIVTGFAPVTGGNTIVTPDRANLFVVGGTPAVTNTMRYPAAATITLTPGLPIADAP